MRDPNKNGETAILPCIFCISGYIKYYRKDLLTVARELKQIFGSDYVVEGIETGYNFVKEFDKVKDRAKLVLVDVIMSGDEPLKPYIDLQAIIKRLYPNVSTIGICYSEYPFGIMESHQIFDRITRRKYLANSVLTFFEDDLKAS